MIDFIQSEGLVGNGNGQYQIKKIPYQMIQKGLVELECYGINIKVDMGDETEDVEKRHRAVLPDDKLPWRELVGEMQEEINRLN